MGGGKPTLSPTSIRPTIPASSHDIIAHSHSRHASVFDRHGGPYRRWIFHQLYHLVVFVHPSTKTISIPPILRHKVGVFFSYPTAAVTNENNLQ
jgi:hypothetical protein